MAKHDRNGPDVITPVSSVFLLLVIHLRHQFCLAGSFLGGAVDGAVDDVENAIKTIGNTLDVIITKVDNLAVDAAKNVDKLAVDAAKNVDKLAADAAKNVEKITTKVEELTETVVQDIMKELDELGRDIVKIVDELGREIVKIVTFLENLLSKLWSQFVGFFVSKLRSLVTDD